MGKEENPSSYPTMTNYSYGLVLPFEAHQGQIFGLEREIVLPFSGKTIKTITEVYVYTDDDWVKLDEMYIITMSSLQRSNLTYDTSPTTETEEK